MSDDARTVYSSGEGRICKLCGLPREGGRRSCQCRANPRKSAREAAQQAGDGIVRVGRESKGRKGKTVTTVRGVPGSEDELRALAGELKRLCGTGGALKEEGIEIQGDHRDRLIEALQARGFTVQRTGG